MVFFFFLRLSSVEHRHHIIGKLEKIKEHHRIIYVQLPAGFSLRSDCSAQGFTQSGLETFFSNP